MGVENLNMNVRGTNAASKHTPASLFLQPGENKHVNSGIAQVLRGVLIANNSLNEH